MLGRSRGNSIKESENPEEILGSNSFVLLLKLCGVLPIKLSPNSLGFAQHHRILFYGFLFLSVCITVGLLASIEDKIHKELSKDPVRNHIRELKIIVNLVSMFFLTAWPVIYLKQIRQLLLQIISFMNHVNLDLEAYRKKIRYYSYFCVIMSLTATIVEIVIRVAEYTIAGDPLTVRHYLVVVFDLVYLRMMLTIMLIADLMLLVAYLRKCWQPPNLEGDTSEYLDSFLQLCNACDNMVSDLNNYTGLFLLIYCFNFVVNIVYSVYDVSIILSSEFNLGIMEKIWSVSAYWLATLFFVTSAGERIEDEYQNSANTLASAAPNSSNEVVQKKVSLYLMKHSIVSGSVSAWGFFQINNELVVAMFGAIATYVIVLLEFKQGGRASR